MTPDEAPTPEMCVANGSGGVSNEIPHAKNIVDNVRQYEKNEMPLTAEIEIEKLFRIQRDVATIGR